MRFVRVRRVFKLAAAAALVAPTIVMACASPAAADDGDTVWTTGLGSDGQLGTGGTGNRTTFARVTSLANVDEVVGGREHVAALINGAVWTWGDGAKGATGLGSTADRSVPTLVTGVATGTTTVTNISAGHYHTLALLSDGTVRSWGYNKTGQLGDGTTARRLAPVTVTGLSNVIDIVGGRDMSYALLANGTVRSWGAGANGELGNGSHTAIQSTPVSVTGLTGVVALAGGRNHALAIRSDGRVWSWGLNSSGQLGDGTKTSRATPIQVQGITDATAVVAGANHSVALRAGGTVLTWGEAGLGQLGSGNRVDRTVPAAVSGLPPIAFVGCGRDQTLAVTVSGQLWDWGQNDFGQLGDGTVTRRLTPIQVPDIADAVEAHGGRGYSVLRRNTA